ncbi:phosphoglycerate mutase [Fusobacterium nucleatum subsp. nucleatum ATCC 23726]|uniref:phosphoglycerate mutase (2,3-diphosphoglycerate-dependent) n=2 Tax=Fusobacterium nucleatum subsp. nucleatum TaxID=76856 RepID=Q8RFG8_FUSNN|nr:histidine phosphatase family protein [Fusobacterium nucleatum]AAL94926.1 Phosphoglycerate mutase [Fusobacterium nucleatum subsp. nucleatum ATCC 25586]AVQ15128.1 phosphoglycerate mutase [Fusobacterium nucleatum subsp. nucleatum ATCC 25586]AVQ23599.1 phosphoglycerate mutase [Fusobacterium nucleatum subsp. nucleatum ATCC 23726]EFG95782.1 phosphoglycerate mutase 1 family [Fusobacterium nucleatum subsp. nucleatum ATCC 23726]WMS30023.1 histidine phosphatase family protein [Fusobacterium nucleatum
MKKIIIFFLLIIAITGNSEIIKEKKILRKETMELILVCHEKIQSDFENIDLSPSGIEAVKQLAEKMKKNYSFDIAYTSNLKIANRTLNYILEEMNELEIPINKSETLNTITRKDLEGKNVFESLKSYWKSDISKNLKEGKNVLIVTDEDTIRILIKYLLDMSDRDIQDVYIPIDNTFYFEVDKNLEVISAGFPIQKVLERIDEF